MVVPPNHPFIDSFSMKYIIGTPITMEIPKCIVTPAMSADGDGSGCHTARLSMSSPISSMGIPGS